MYRAWAIANVAALKFGGKAVEYIAGAMKMAWKKIKAVVKPIYIEVSEGSRKHKSYVAELKGNDDRWGFIRNFVSEDHEELRVKYAYLQEDSVYEIQDGGDREYAIVKNNELVYMEYSSVKSYLANN